MLAIFSQYGNPVFVDLMRDKDTGKSKGFAFLKYEDQRSTVLAVDNLDGATVLGRTIRVDHTFYKAKRDDEELANAMSFDAPTNEREEKPDADRRARDDKQIKEEGKVDRHRHRERSVHDEEEKGRHRSGRSTREEDYDSERRHRHRRHDSHRSSRRHDSREGSEKAGDRADRRRQSSGRRRPGEEGASRSNSEHHSISRRHRIDWDDAEMK